MTTQTDLIPLTRGVPAEESFPIDELVICVESALRRNGKTLLQYHPAGGFGPLRETLADEDNAAFDQILVGNGSIQLFDLLTRTLLSPGDTVLVERPTYDRAITTLRNAGAHVVGVPVEEDGVDLSLFEDAIRRYLPRLVYLIPDFQNPSGATLSAAKRQAVVDLTRRHAAHLVIDVPYRRLRYFGEDEPSLFHLDPERVIQMSSFSKLISPGLRVGWMIAPKAITAQVARLAEDTYITPSMLPQGAVYEFLRQGRLPGAIERLKALYRPRLERLLEELRERIPEASWFRPQGGFFLGLNLPQDVSDEAFARFATSEGLKLTDGRGFYADGDGARFVRIPFCALHPAQITEAVARLSRALELARATAAKEASHAKTQQ